MTKLHPASLATALDTLVIELANMLASSDLRDLPATERRLLQTRLRSLESTVARARRMLEARKQ